MTIELERPISVEEQEVENYYLESLEKPTPEDSFPNVGYVRRMKALLNQ